MRPLYFFPKISNIMYIVILNNFLDKSIIPERPKSVKHNTRSTLDTNFFYFLLFKGTLPSAVSVDNYIPEHVLIALDLSSSIIFSKRMR